MVVGRDQRLFAAHEDILSLSPFFTTALKDQFYEGSLKRVALPDEFVIQTVSFVIIPNIIVQRARDLFLYPRIPLQGRLLPTPAAQ